MGESLFITLFVCVIFAQYINAPCHKSFDSLSFFFFFYRGTTSDTSSYVLIICSRDM